MGLTGAGPVDQHGVTLLAEVTTGEITHERLVDGRTLELQVVEVLGGAAGPDVVVGINIGREGFLFGCSSLSSRAPEFSDF